MFDPGARPVAEIPLLRMAMLQAKIAAGLAAIGTFAVEGEVVKPRCPYGRTYFDLQDRGQQISVMCDRRCRGVELVRDGERVQVTGRLEWVAKRGIANVAATEIVPVGEGAIAAAIAAVRARLDSDGLLARPRRRLPMLPARVGVVCGKEAAVRADIESVIAARFPNYPVLFAETLVSGPGAAGAIQAAMEHLDDIGEIEVIILARGGGDASSMLPFSDEQLCRSIAARRAVVVSAIGHDSDRPLSDEVADYRFGTPSLAAAAVFPARAELERALAHSVEAARRALEARLDRAGSAMGGLSPAAALGARLTQAEKDIGRCAVTALRRRPSGRIDKARAALAAPQVPVLARRRHSDCRRDLDAKMATVAALDPRAVLDRGYAVVQRSTGEVLRRAEQAGEGEVLELLLARGALSAKVAAILGREDLEAAGGVAAALARIPPAGERSVGEGGRAGNG